MLDHRINEVDLALGFEFRKDPKYYHFPLWIYHNEFISPSASLEDIRALLEQINAPSTRVARDAVASSGRSPATTKAECEDGSLTS